MNTLHGVDENVEKAMHQAAATADTKQNKARAITCTGCGANNFIDVDGAECEYCGVRLSID